MSDAPMKSWRLGNNACPILGNVGIAQMGENGFLAFFRLHGIQFTTIASWGMGWDHVSVSSRRTPTWEEMELARQSYLGPESVAMQLHVPVSQWINNHPHCLHIWRPQEIEIPTPPDIMVGVRGAT